MDKKNINDSKDITIAVIGSHSALDVCRGAKDEGFKTLVIAQKGREKTYQHYYKTRNGFATSSDHSELSDQIGCVDEIIVLDKFADILKPSIQEELRKRNVIFIPHRSFEAYLKFDYDQIENFFQVPIYGNRFLLKIEERGMRPNQYDLMDKAQIRYPKVFESPKDIDRVCIVKVLESEREFERAFFLVDSYEDYKQQTEQKITAGVFNEDQLSKAVIEEFVLGVQANFNFFYSPINDRLELLGTDTRRQTNIEGVTKLQGNYQKEILKKISIQYEEAGHIAVTVLESLLEDAFELGERFVKATQEGITPGIIGPFALQSIIIPGPPKKEIVVIDISPRMPGSPGVSATPYSGYLFGKNISVGRRIALEIKQAVQEGKLDTILT